MNLFNQRTAVFSDCRRYRYVLAVKWADLEPLVFLMLNPSTADEVANDPTVERCQRRAQADPTVGGLVVLNLFAWRSTDPKGLLTAADPIGPGNDAAIRELTRGRTVVCAWGQIGKLMGRARQVLDILDGNGSRLLCLGVNQDGSPKHPLYVPYHEQPRAYRWRNVTATAAIAQSGSADARSNQLAR